MTPKAGDRVTVVARDMTADDAKSGLYYSFFGGLVGQVDRVYDDGTVCVDIDLECLTEDIRARHIAVQEAERKRWLDGLSDEMRNRLTAEQKQLKMSYRILVGSKDLEVTKGGKPSGQPRNLGDGAADPSAGEKKAAPRAPTPSPQSAAQAGARPSPPREDDAEEKTPPKRLSEAELSAAEEAFLRSRQSSP